METIFVIEDDPVVQRSLKRLFEKAGFRSLPFLNGSEAIRALHSDSPAAVILDLRLPGMPGSVACKEIKNLFPQLPVIILSAAAETSTKVDLLESGADDYVTKPFSPRELLARLKTAIRRTILPNHRTFRFGEVSADFHRMTITRDGAPAELTALEFKLLKFLSTNVGRVLSREELLNVVWGYHTYPTTRTVDNHIMRLRQKLEVTPNDPKHFVTVHGIGYKFVA